MRRRGWHAVPGPRLPFIPPLPPFGDPAGRDVPGLQAGWGAAHGSAGGLQGGRIPRGTEIVDTRRPQKFPRMFRNHPRLR